MDHPSYFQITSTLIFVLAIIHTFLTPTFFRLAERLKKRKDQEIDGVRWKKLHFFSEIFYLLSEVEIVLGIWLIPLIFLFILMNGYDAAVNYLNSITYTYSLYIVVIVVVVGSRPIIAYAEKLLDICAHLAKDTPAAWWWTLLTIGPLLGAIVKEPAAMAISAILLSKKFYHYNPSRLFQYATLGLLFANVSVGGMLTSFSSRALFIVADVWGWDWLYMLTRFGWKAVIGILLANTLYYFVFRKEFVTRFPAKLPKLKKEEHDETPPLWITLIHLFFLALIVIFGENAPLFIGAFILFLGFWKATSFYQAPLHLRSAIFVGFFFASLLIHGKLQGWWFVPLMHSFGDFGTMMGSFVLSGFIDNAVVSYLSLEVPGLDEMKHYLIVVGAMSAGALTIIANAPNPVGHAILRGVFQSRISLVGLLLGALAPSLIFLAVFWFSRMI